MQLMLTLLLMSSRGERGGERRDMGREQPPDPLEGFSISESKEGAVNRHVVICTHCRKFSCSKNSVRLKYHLNAKKVLVGSSGSGAMPEYMHASTFCPLSSHP